MLAVLVQLGLQVSSKSGLLLGLLELVQKGRGIAKVPSL